MEVETEKRLEGWDPEEVFKALFALADPDIRYCVLASLDERFDAHLAQAENLQALFVALNDQVFEIRELAICTVGRLSSMNPAFVMPFLRKMLIQVTGWPAGRSGPPQRGAPWGQGGKKEGGPLPHHVCTKSPGFPALGYSLSVSLSSAGCEVLFGSRLTSQAAPLSLWQVFSNPVSWHSLLLQCRTRASHSSLIAFVILF